MPPKITLTHHYPFGSMIENRSWSAGNGYRYGFQSWECDDEVKGAGNHVSFADYGYDSRLGRRLSLDPKSNKYPSYAPYSAFGNNPIFHIDINGKEFINPYSQIRADLWTEVNRQRNTLGILYSSYGSNVESLSRKQFKQSGAKRNQWKADWKEYSGDVARYNNFRATLRLVEEKEIRTDHVLCELYDNHPTAYNYFNTYTVNGQDVHILVMNDLVSKDEYLRLTEYGSISINPGDNPSGVFVNDLQISTELIGQDNAIPLELKMLKYGENLRPDEKGPNALNVLKHELGHFKAETLHRNAVQRFYQDSGIRPNSDGGHAPGNPSGNMADDFQRQNSDFDPSTIEPRND